MAAASVGCRLKASSVPDDEAIEGEGVDGPSVATKAPPLPSVAEPLRLEALASFAEVAERLAPNVVTIRSRGTLPPDVSRPISVLPPVIVGSVSGEQSSDPSFTALGTGFLVRADASVITSATVVNGTSQLAVQLHDGRELEAIMHSEDQELDVAVLSLEEPVTTAITLPDATRVRAGDEVAVLSNPFGVGIAVTSGVVRFAATRDLPSSRHPVLRSFIGVDATIDAANRGGLVVDAGGRLVGLAVTVSRDGGVGFVLPAASLRRTISRPVQRVDTGRVSIGLWARPLDRERAAALGVEPPGGLVVTRVAPTGPAQEAGVEVDDVIVELAGETIDSPSTFGSVAAGVGPNREVPLVVLRDGRPRVLRIRLTSALP